VDALLDDYFEKFYGRAAKPMADYFAAMEQSMQAWNGCASYGLQGVGGLRVVGPKVFTPPVMQRMRVSLEEAERLTAEDRIHSKRVALARKMYQETEEALKKIK
jgi:hypothetical protein